MSYEYSSGEHSEGNDYIVELGKLLGTSLLSMLCCHFDESEGFIKSPVLVVAGFCGGVQQWQFFSTEWLDVLRAYGLKSPFKMQHFERRKEQFRSFPEEKRQPLLRDLLNTISRRAMMGFGSVVHLEPYSRLITGDVKRHIGSAYALCIAGCFWGVGRWARMYNHDEPIAYIFDQGHKNAGDALLCHQKHSNVEEFRVGWRLGSITFDSDERVIPLQAADLFAYESLRRCTERAVLLMSRNQRLTGENIRYPIRELLSNMKLQVRFFDEDTLIQLRDNYLHRGVVNYDRENDTETPIEQVNEKINTICVPEPSESSD